jgi:hypothetical protein
MENIKKILDNNILQFIAIAILSLLLLKQCGETDHAKKEALRNFNNLLAEQDSVRIISSKLGNTIAEKSAFELKYNELNEEQKKLIERLEIEKKKKPSIIIKTEIEYKDSLIVVPVRNVTGKNGNRIEFTYEPDLPGNNKLTIDGKIRYEIKTDSIEIEGGKWNYMYRLEAGKANISILQKIDLVTGLYKDSKTGRLYVRASTTFPGITFSEMQALNIVDDPATKKALKEERKPFGVGAFVGAGLGFSSSGYVMGPVVGVGLTYQPKWLQFGK